MATVSDGSLMSMAQDIVTEFMDKKVTLNEGVTKKASEMGLNTDQTKRLIERTNTEAFLRVYPSTTEFDVADPGVILGEKVANIANTISISKTAATEDSDEGMFKAASAEKKNTSADRYNQKVASVEDFDIFGMNSEEFQKEASTGKLEYALDKESQAMMEALHSINKTASEIERENFARELEFNDRLEDLAERIKQASLDGTESIAASEEHLLTAFPDRSDFIHTLYDTVVEKMASWNVPPEKLTRFTGDINNLQKFASDSDIVRCFRNLIIVAEG